MRAPRAGVLALFEHQHAGAFAEHEAVAALVPGTRGRGRVVVAGGQRPRGGEAADAQREIVESAPPATITSASPYWISRADSPMLCRPVVQAVTTPGWGRCSRSLIDT
jgi:hypothetical protein